MNTETPTPETDLIHEMRNLEFRDVFSQYFEMTEHARSLERRLAIARDALARIDDELKRQNFTIGGTLRMMVDEALTQTGPKL